MLPNIVAFYRPEFNAKPVLASDRGEDTNGWVVDGRRNHRQTRSGYARMAREPFRTVGRYRGTRCDGAQRPGTVAIAPNSIQVIGMEFVDLAAQQQRIAE